MRRRLADDRQQGHLFLRERRCGRIGLGQGGRCGRGGRGGREGHARVVRLPTRFQLREDLGEEGGLRVDLQHVSAQSVDDEEAAVPELLLVVLHQEGLQRVGDLVAHVGVAHVEAGEDDGLKLLLRLHLLADQLSQQEVHKDHVRWVDEGNVLKGRMVSCELAGKKLTKIVNAKSLWIFCNFLFDFLRFSRWIEGGKMAHLQLRKRNNFFLNC